MIHYCIFGSSHTRQQPSPSSGYYSCFTITACSACTDPQHFLVQILVERNSADGSGLQGVLTIADLCGHEAHRPSAIAKSHVQQSLVSLRSCLVVLMLAPDFSSCFLCLPDPGCCRVPLAVELWPPCESSLHGRVRRSLGMFGHKASL